MEHRKKETEVLPSHPTGKTSGEANAAVDALVDERLAKRGVSQVSISIRASGRGSHLKIAYIKGK